ncbi:hypothetical protein OG948_37660 (plasmid) [Embleya sp. NBC_00888]|uniref:hypothetical protein n=1 Tax=Embleya sp. NBC_00888 TaxID=2975960 RepID=UPI002F90BD8B|nr:hypothetical protein OG948_37660 [Embleya sp. NBC_00888]
MTVVDDRVFTAAITTDGHLDWRTAGTACHYTPVTAPADIEAACVEHVRDLGLTYAALDFVVDEHRRHYLETNPAGEFGLIQARTDLPIAQEIARLLVRGSRSPHPPVPRRSRSHARQDVTMNPLWAAAHALDRAEAHGAPPGPAPPAGTPYGMEHQGIATGDRVACASQTLRTSKTPWLLS